MLASSDRVRRAMEGEDTLMPLNLHVPEHILDIYRRALPTCHGHNTVESMMEAAIENAALDWQRSEPKPQPTEELKFHADTDPQPKLTDADHAHGGKWK